MKSSVIVLLVFAFALSFAAPAVAQTEETPYAM